MSLIIANKLKRYALGKLDAWAGGVFYDLNATLNAMALRPFELHLELTNICNANCIFCPYQFQEAEKQVMSDTVFNKAVGDFVDLCGGSVGLTPRVGDPLIDPKFLDRVRYLRTLPAIDRIFLTTNGILLDKFGIKEILSSGISTINISTSGFDKTSYERIYRTKQYDRMRENVIELFRINMEMNNPVNLSIGIRPDRPVSTIMKDPDFAPLLKLKPNLDITIEYSSSGDKIKTSELTGTMKLRSPPAKTETCANLYNGAIIYPNGSVGGCACHVSIDSKDLVIGNILKSSLGDIWVGEKIQQLRLQFDAGNTLNPTCAACDVAQNLDIYRRKEGRIRAHLNNARHAGSLVKRNDKPKGIFAGG